MAARDAMEKDYYATLGVAKDASQADIKKAYRTLARDLHPDNNPGGEERFKEVSEAYGVLSDEAKRKDYDEQRELFGAGRFAGGFPGGGGAQGFDLGDLFGRAGAGRGGFDLGGLFGNRGARGRPGVDVETTATLSFLDSLQGTEVPVRLTTTGACETCRGSGAAPGTAPRPCEVCGGAGSVRRDQGSFAFAEPCQHCRGTGRVIDTPCTTCHGSGATRQERTLTVRIPAGMEDGKRVRVAGKGGPGEHGGPPGDLYVRVHVTPHRLFRRRGEDVALTVPITFAEAALGSQLKVPTPEGGTVTLKVAPGTTSGRTLRAKGKGGPGRKAPRDLLVTVEVAVPASLSDEARTALEAFAAAQPDDPRAGLLA
jgi:molecular chaperone DnaJ